MEILVGYTGFVGSNLSEKHFFDFEYNSKNIEEAYGKNPDLLVYAGVTAEKFLANTNAAKDLEVIMNAFENIKKINPKKLVLISTVDVYSNPIHVDENFVEHAKVMQAYGNNRLHLEKLVQDAFPDSLIVRLPGLYGNNIKKNFIYDFIHVIPKMLNKQKYTELLNMDSAIEYYYSLQDNGFYKCKDLDWRENRTLKEYFNKVQFSALNFTDSRGIFQFYNLSYLWDHITVALNNNIKKLNIATEPVSISELYQYLTNQEFKNEVTTVIPQYNFKTTYSSLFGGKDGYIFDKQFILEDIKKFVNQNLIKLSISNIAWLKEDDTNMYSYLKEVGYNGIEIAPTRIFSSEPYSQLEGAKSFAKQLKNKYSLNISSMQSIWYGINENIFESEKSRRKLIDYTKQAIDFAKTIRCKNLVFGNPKNRTIGDNTQYLIAIEFFREIGEYAVENGVVIAVEPNPEIYNTNFINTTREAFDFVKDVNCDAIKVNVDLGTIIENKEDINIILEHILYVNHVHLSEPYLEVLKERELHKQLSVLLDKVAYNNYVSIEMKNDNSVENVKDAIEYVKGVFRS